MQTKEMAILETLAEYKLMSMTQLHIHCFSSKQMAGRTIRDLVQQRLIEVSPRAFGKSTGRPENIYSLNANSIKLLKDAGYLNKSFPTSHLTALSQRCLEHQLLVNWTRIFLHQIERQQPDLKVNYLSPVSNRDSYQIPTEVHELASALIPDGIFSITSVAQKKTLLFFLEIDMGTETLSSLDPRIPDIKTKILSYQHIFRTSLYKRYESQFQATLNGFRTLFIADTAIRFEQLCRLIKSVKSTDFIWLTDQGSIFDSGISDRIWIKGGDTEKGRYSILGPTLTFRAPFHLADNPLKKQ
jgi:hypothetical protein